MTKNPKCYNHRVCMHVENRGVIKTKETKEENWKKPSGNS